MTQQIFNNTSGEDKRKTETKKETKIGPNLLKGIILYYWFWFMIKLLDIDLEYIIRLIL